MSEIPKAYEPQAVESKWYQYWLEQKCFAADPARVSAKRPAYSIVIPPPNVTGMLHMGHVLNNTIQDILARKARMDGKEVLWLPGTDHAGIATQAVVEKTLIKQGQIRHRDDLGRDKFLEKVWEWKAKHGDIIIEQLKKLGASCDWGRERFTMDPEYSKCVQRVFVDLYRKGLIYRGKRMVNWDPSARTALSDEEVEMIETKGHLWHFKYPLLDDQDRPRTDAFVVVATTRPETMLGDEAVAVNPRDERYTHLVGRRILLPLQNKPIPLIADDLVDPTFGTGCVKVTPAHDPADYEMAVRHKLPFTVVIGPDGRMTPEAGAAFATLTRDQARKAVVAAMEQAGLLLKIEDYVHNVGHSQRSHVPIEPYLSEQWFLRYPSQAAARACVADGTMQFFPDRWAKVFDHWMGNLRDWCISRQLWWGHRVPVWTRRVPTTDTTMRMRRDRARVCATLVELARNGGAASEECPLFEDSWSGVEDHRTFWRVRGESGTDTEWEAATFSELEARALEAEGWVQDPDVLDTWFSSALWPISTLGWPDDTVDMRAFYPTSTLITGFDILFFWVARMIMMGCHFTGKAPFGTVHLTGLVRDAQRQKMSKTKGNVMDPLDLVHRYGADAVRFTLAALASPGRDLPLDEKRMEGYRAFGTKLWNAARFVQMYLTGNEKSLAEVDRTTLALPERWIVAELGRTVAAANKAWQEFRFDEACRQLYQFVWHDFCDWYVELAKPVLMADRGSGTEDRGPGRRGEDVRVVARGVLLETLKLLHPVMPFISEEIAAHLGHAGMLMTTAYPTAEGWPVDEAVLQCVTAVQSVVQEVRSYRHLVGLAPGKPLKLWVLGFPSGLEAGWKPHFEALAAEICRLAVLDQLEFDERSAPAGAVRDLAGGIHIAIGLPEGAIGEAERARLASELEQVTDELRRLRARLADEGFAARAPQEVVAGTRSRAQELEHKAAMLAATLGGR